MAKHHKNPNISPKGLIVAIDGPVASGKGTVAKRLVKKLGAISYYTGSMYRALALKCIQNKIDFNNREKVLELLENTKINLAKKIAGNYSKVILDGCDVTDRIFDNDVAQGSSIVSHIREVREYMVIKQREMALNSKKNRKIVIMEGRDIGTNVVKDADLKFFLTAGVEIRAKRRQKQYSLRGIIKSRSEVISEIKERDKRDLESIVSPLASHPDKFGYILIDNSELTIQETVDKILYLVLDKLNI